MKLWKDNRLDQEHEIPNEDVAAGYLASDYAKVAMPLERMLNLYIANPDGLSSTWGDPHNAEDRHDFDAVLDLIVDNRP